MFQHGRVEHARRPALGCPGRGAALSGAERSAQSGQGSVGDRAAPGGGHCSSAQGRPSQALLGSGVFCASERFLKGFPPWISDCPHL